MRTNLLPHNKTAYKKVMKAFETADKTCVIHPTGTGKSYLIAAVSESYKKVLILAPNIFVLGQVESVTNWHPTIDYMTYAYLNSRGSDKQYDLIVLDEFHRAGATEWGEAVKTLLSQQHGKVFGTTATPIRYLDEGRNMAEEIFDGNIASQMSIGEAWNRNILPIPTYVTGLFDFKNTAEEVRERIKAAKRITDKNERLRQLAQFELDWERSDGMPQVIRKHISQDTKRVIVFCNSVKHLNTMKPTIADWFKQAGLAVADIYSICHETDRENTDQMEAFEQDTNDGVKIMLAVNMLNEGVHIPRVDAVIMLRTTASRIIYMQQLGRCLTAANTARPVVLDMVDNISNANVIGSIKTEFEALEQQDYEKDGEHKKTPRQFTITDYTHGIQKVVEKLTEGTARIIPLYERLENIERFVKEHGRLPIESEREAYSDWTRLLFYKDREPRVMELMEEYPRRRTSDVIADEYVKFCKEHNRLPFKKTNEGEYSLWSYINRHREEMFANYPELKEQFDKYNKRQTSEERYNIVASFIETNSRRPIKEDGEPFRHERYLINKCDDEYHYKIMSLVKQFKPDLIAEGIALVESFCKQHNRLPRKCDKIYNRWKSYVKKHSDDQRVIALKERYRMISFSTPISKKVNDVKIFCEKNNRLPQPKDGKIFSSWGCLRKEHHPMFDILREQYRKTKRWYERLDELKAFVMENHQMPSKHKNDDLANYWAMVRAKHKDDPRVIEIRKLSRYDEKGQPSW